MTDRNPSLSISIRQLALDGVFTAVLTVLGMIRLPSVLPGAEFQLSAPYAVCLASLVGFRRYLGIGICSSVIQFALGSHTIWNVLVAMVFRIVAGLFVELCPFRKSALILAGPAGTGCARLVLAAIQHLPALPLLLAALPGMGFTSLCAVTLEPVFRRILPAGSETVRRVS